MFIPQKVADTSINMLSFETFCRIFIVENFAYMRVFHHFFPK